MSSRFLNCRLNLSHVRDMKSCRPVWCPSMIVRSVRRLLLHRHRQLRLDQKQHFATLLCFLVSGFVPALTPILAQQPRSPFNDPSLPMKKRIDNLLSLMTVDEKVSCLSTNTGVPSPTSPFMI
jgi:hypothetical protein